MYHRRSFGLLAAAAVLAPLVLASAQPADAQTKWPTQTVKIVVPYPAGGGADGLARALTDHLSAMWGQSVIIENRSGAGGNVGAEQVFRSPPDGHNILSAATPVYTINPTLYKKLKYDPTKLKSAVMLGGAPSLFAIHPSIPAKSVKEFIAIAKAAPGTMTYGSQGNGSTAHLTGAWFASAAGVKLTHVPYRGSAPMLNDLIGGHIKLAFDNLASARTQYQAGKIKVLAVGSEKRSSFVPELPTMIEAGIPGFVSVSSFGMTLPPGTPDEIVDKISRDVNTVLARPDVKKRYEALGAEVFAGTPADMDKLILAERSRWADVIKTNNIPLID